MTMTAVMTMKAVRIHGYGGIEELHVEDVPFPEVGPQDVLIHTHAAGVNPFDWKVRAGYLAAWLQHSLPLTLGWDVAGVVAAVGQQVTHLRPGDEVYARTDLSRDGAYAEYVAAPADAVVAKPRSLDFINAAAVPNAALAAWAALFDAAQLRAGQTVLIHGAAGGVGSFAVQLAKHAGATALGTASEHNHAFLRWLGADDVIDYNTVMFEDRVHDVDVVLDTIGGYTLARSWEVLRPGGMLVSLVQPPDASIAEARGMRQRFVSAEINAPRLAEIAQLIDMGRLRPIVSAVFPLGEAQRAHELSAGGHACGKIVLRVAE